METQIYYCDILPKKHLNTVLKGLRDQAFNARGLKAREDFAITIENNQNELVAAVSGNILYKSMYIDLLFVEIKYRGQKFGIRLMNHCEQLAQDKDCNFMILTTMDWEAKPFYEKLGFKVEYQRSGYENNSIMYIMRKDLSHF